MARCLVIGGNGFLGSHLVDALVEGGHDVTAFDRFTLPQSFRSTSVTSVVADLSDRTSMARALRGQDFLFPMVSLSTPASSDSDPLLDVQANVAGSVQLFQAAVEAGVTRVVFPSTGGAMYGDQVSDRITELALPNPISPYAIGKLAIEGYLRYFRHKHGLESVSLRISNPYGPRQHPNKKQGVIPIFLHHIAKGKPVTVLGDGSMVRDYIYVDDVARMMAAVVGQVPLHSVYNIGSGTGTSLDEVLRLAVEITGVAVTREHLPRPVTFVERSVLDASRFENEFGLSATMSLRDGMERTWRYTLEQLR